MALFSTVPFGLVMVLHGEVTLSNGRVTCRSASFCIGNARSGKLLYRNGGVESRTAQFSGGAVEFRKAKVSSGTARSGFAWHR